MKHFVTLPYLLSMYSTSSGRGFLPLVIAAHEISPTCSCMRNPGEGECMIHIRENHVILPCLYVTYCNCVCSLLTECSKTNLDKKIRIFLVKRSTRYQIKLHLQVIFSRAAQSMQKNELQIYCPQRSVARYYLQLCLSVILSVHSGGSNVTIHGPVKMCSLEIPPPHHMGTPRPVQTHNQLQLQANQTCLPKPVQTCPLLSPYIYRQASNWSSTRCPSCLKFSCPPMHSSNPNWRWEIWLTTDMVVS